MSQLVGRQRVVVVPVALDVVLRVADVAVFEDAFFLNIGEPLLFSGRRGVGSLDADPPLQRIDLRQAAAAERVGQCESVDGVVLGIPGAAGPVVGIRAAADRVVLKLHDPDTLGVAGRTVLIVFDEHVAEIVAGIVLGVAEAAFHQTVIRAVDHVLGILLGQLIVAFGAAQQVHFAQQVACGPRRKLALLHVVGIVGKVRLGKFQVFDDVAQHLDLGIAREREQEGLLDGFDPGHVAVEVDQRAVGVSPEETGFGLVKLFVGGIVPVVVLFGIDQQFVGRSDQVVGPVPVRADEKRRRVERHFGERNQRTVADGSHAAEVGRNLEHLVGAGAVVHESAVFTPGVVFRAGDGVEPRGSHLEAQ